MRYPDDTIIAIIR